MNESMGHLRLSFVANGTIVDVGDGIFELAGDKVQPSGPRHKNVFKLLQATPFGERGGFLMRASREIGALGKDHDGRFGIRRLLFFWW